MTLLPTAALARLAIGNRKATIILISLLVLLSLLRGPHIELRTSNLDLIDPDLPEVHHFLSFAQHFGTPNALVIVLEGDDSDKLRHAVDVMAPRLRALPEVRVILDSPPYERELLVNNGLDPYLSNDMETMFFIFAQPKDERSNTSALAPFVSAVEKVIANAGVVGPEVHVGLTGIPKYALDDQQIIGGDISKLSLLALVLVFLVFLLGFPSLKGPLLACVTLLVSLILCIGLVSFYPGHLTILSAMFASMIFGLGIDYGIHIVHHVEELRSSGKNLETALIETFVALETPLNAATLTTSGVFLMLAFSGFRGFSELGIIAGAGILLCYLMMATLMPVLWLSLPETTAKKARQRAGDKLLIKGQNRWVAPAFILATLLLIAVGWPGFDGNYLNLQPANSPAAALERRMLDHSDYSPYFAAFIAENQEAAQVLTDKLHAEDTVADVRSLADLAELFEEGESAIPVEFRGAFQDAKGRLAVYAYPAIDIWDMEANSRFLKRMHAIDASATGMPFLGDFMVNRSKQALKISAGLSLGVLLLITTVSFRDWRKVALAITVPIVTMLWMGGMLKLLGLAFNPLNVMAIPIVLGIAVDDSVHIIHRYCQSRGNLSETLSSAGGAVVLTSLTTLAAFATMIFTSHRGLQGFAIALSLGVLAALLLSIFLLPWLLRLLHPNFTDK